MPEVLRQFAGPVLSSDRLPYRAQVVGAEMEDGRWEGWIEFIPLAGGTPVRTPRETTQPNRADTFYWATGLSTTYMEGALSRALDKPVVVASPERAEPFFRHAAPAVTDVSMSPPPVEAVLDPFSVFEKGEALLRAELGALSSWHLVNILRRYRIADSSEEALDRLPQGDLIEMIVAGVRRQSSVAR
jgi:hypothetical protein